MKRPYLLIIAIVVFFWALIPGPFFVKAEDSANEKPEVCSGPSEMMSQYFNFQKEAISILGGSKVEERLMQVTFSKNGLFGSKILDLPVTAIDLLASGLKVKSSISNIITSSVLLLFISASVVESNVDGFEILFRDRPIVRDYKQMLDIETQLFDVAYFRSKQIDLTRPMEGDIGSRLDQLIKDYQESGLLSQKNFLSKDSMAGIIIELIKMNTAMKDFIAFGDDVSLFKLDNYLNSGAIDELSEDYSEVRAFSACNSYLTSIKNTLNGITKNDSVKTAGKDIKDSTDRLTKALLGDGAWNFKNNRKDMCDNIGEYEMAQLKAYWGPDWTCGSLLKVNGESVDISSTMLKVKDYFKKKKEERQAKKESRKVRKAERKVAKAEQKAKNKADKLEQKAEKEVKKAEKEAEKEEQKAKKAEEKNAAKNAKNEEKMENSDAVSVINGQVTTEEKKQEWYRIYSTGSEYNPEFSLELYVDFEGVFDEIMAKYQQSQTNAIDSDVSSILPMGKGILDQIDSVLNEDKKNTSSIKNLRKNLQKIVDKQCSS